MDERKKLVAITIVGYTAFIVLMTLTFAPQGYQQLATESAAAHIASSVGLFVSFLALAVYMLPRGLKWVSVKLVWGASAVVLICQTLFALLNHSLLTLPTAVLLCLHAATGASFSILFTFWTGVSYLFDRRNFQFCILAGSLISAFVAILISPFQSDALLIATKLIAIVAVAIACTLLSSHAKELDKKQTGELSSMASSTKGLLLPILCTGSLGFAYQYSWMVAGTDSQASLYFSVGQACATSLVLLVAAAPGVKSISIGRCFRVICPIACIFVLLQAFTSGTVQVLCMSIVSATFNLCIILLLPLCASMAKQKSLSAPGLYAMSSSVVYAFMALGCLMGLLPEDYAGVSLCVLAFVVLAILSASILLSKDDSYDFALVLGNDSDEAPSAEGPIDKPTNREFFASLLSEEYGLTKRETEVLRMLLLGRDAPSISEELCISTNTVKTHVKHIYAKLDIHSRQELIDMVEDFEKTLRQSL